MRYGLTGTSKVRGSTATTISPIAAGQPGAGYTKLPDNSYVLNADMEALQQSWPEGYKILTEQGYTAYSMAVADAKTAITKQAGTSSDITAKYSALTVKQKTPVTDIRGLKTSYPGLKAPQPGFDKILALSSRATDIPKEQGFYSYTISEWNKGESKQYKAPDYLTYPRGEKKAGGFVSFSPDVSTKTTFIYARLADGSVIQVDKTVTSTEHGPMWSDQGRMGGQKVPISWKWWTEKGQYQGGSATHEQKLGAQKLSKEKGIPYKQAVGLVSASGYYDPASIVEAEKGVWGAYTPEVASAIGKLKPFEKADGTYDWSRIVATKDTQAAIAATKISGIELGALKGVKDSIKAYPELGEALSKGGWEGYQVEAEKIRKKWEADLKENSPEYYEIYKKEGYIGLEKSIEEANAEYAAWQARVKSGEVILLPDGQYIEKTDLEEQSEGTQKILREEGFKGYEALLEPDWENLQTHKVITQTQFHQMVEDYEAAKKKLAKQGKMYTPEWDALGDHPTSIWTLTPESTQRDVIKLVANIAPAARAGLKEYTIKDISAIEWGLTAVNTILLASAFAPGAIVGSLAGRAAVSGISASGAGMIGYTTAKDWADLTTTQRVIGVGSAVLYSLPMLSTVARGIGVRFTSVKIPTAKGEVTVWTGLDVAGNPIIGVSKSKLTIGAKGVKLPSAAEIKAGYKPITATETKIVANADALRKMGIPESEILRLKTTLSEMKGFAGKKSPYLSLEGLLQGSGHLTPAENITMFQQIAKYGKKIKEVLGSTSQRPQLEPSLRSWRKLKDIDIYTNMTADEVVDFIKDTVVKLKAGGGRFRIVNDKIFGKPIEIEKYVRGSWEKITCPHPKDVLRPGYLTKEEIDYTAGYGYTGAKLTEPTITIEYPGVGKIELMRLSESGKRKGIALLRWQKGEFAPMPSRIKDAADFYVILRTFKGKETADSWAAIWAKGEGWSLDKLGRIPAKKALEEVGALIKKPGLRTPGDLLSEVARVTPSDLIGYRFYPSGAKPPPGASPSIMIHAPSSLGVSVSGSLAKKISSPVSPYAVSPKLRASALAAVYTQLSKLKGGLAPSGVLSAISPKIKPSPKASPSPLPLPSPSIGSSPSPASSPGPSPYPYPGASPSPKVGVSPGIVPVVPTGPPPSPPPKVPPTKKTPPGVPVSAASTRGRERDYKGAVAWRQGALKRKGAIVPVYKVWRYPYRQEDLDTFFKNELPPGVIVTPGGAKSAYKSIQLYKGKVPPVGIRQADIGAVLVTVKAPTKLPGRAGAISFTKDVKGIRGTSKEALKKLALGTTLSQLVEGNYNSKIPRSTVSRMLTGKLGGSSAAQIAEVLRGIEAEPSTGEIVAMTSNAEAPVTTGYTKAEVLKRLPDSKRREVERLLTETVGYAPTRGFPKFAIATGSKLSRKKKKTKPVNRRDNPPTASTGRW